jgi:hypothetical protein
VLFVVEYNFCSITLKKLTTKNTKSQKIYDVDETIRSAMNIIRGTTNALLEVGLQKLAFQYTKPATG